MQSSRPIPLPVFYCSDPNVQAFVECEMALITPYAFAHMTKSAVEVFEAARDRFGDWRCWDLAITLH
jgi:hypothetical protein